MKMTIFAFLFTPVVGFASIMPSSSVKGLAPEEILVTCTTQDKELDFTEINVSKTGTLVATVNEIYLKDSKEIAPYIVFEGMTLVETQKTVRVSGSLLSLMGAMEIDFTLKRGQVNYIELMDISFACEVK